MGRRRKASRGKKINPTLFVFCEGETEEAYVNMLKSLFRLPSIQIHPRVSGLSITQEFIEKYKQDKSTHKKDTNFLMYDLDVEGILERLEAIDDCTLLISNPCIELWFLLHFKNQNASTDCAYCCKELANRNRRYKKGVIDKRLKEKLTSKIEDAVRKAKNLTDRDNPSSTIYKLIEKLKELKD
ncbi:MAG: RloB domain-containing protein [Flavobacteriales bacterium]|nr:RloB domain-containing protein [Flavobacteriales bacterium]